MLRNKMVCYLGGKIYFLYELKKGSKWHFFMEWEYFFFHFSPNNLSHYGLIACFKGNVSLAQLESIKALNVHKKIPLTDFNSKREQNNIQQHSRIIQGIKRNKIKHTSKCAFLHFYIISIQHLILFFPFSY